MEDNKPHIDEKLLMQFLLGETTPEQMERVTNWLHESEENQKMLDRLEAVWTETGKLTPTPVAVDVKLAWQKMLEQVDAHGQKLTEKKIIPLNRTKRIRMVSGVAASLLIGLAILRLVVGPLVPAKTEQLASSTIMINGTLPDGSAISLNSNSQLIYPDRFEKRNRTVELKGEAFFKVAHNPKQPFIIHTGNATIKVLGTSFSVKAYPGKNTEVTVASGLVQLYKVDSLTGDTASIKLAAGQKGILPLTSNKPQLLEERLQPDDLFWADKTLIFNQTPLSNVFALLEKHYQVVIQVTNPAVYECRYSATFTNNTIDEILMMIASTYNFELTKKDSVYSLKGNGCLNE